MGKLGKLIWGDGSDPRIELDELFATPDHSGLEGARRWATEVISAAGIPADDELRVIKALRDAEPRLSLKPARYLAAQLAR